jgi:PBP1b-binding outer membrane lipoprotein LpoB
MVSARLISGCEKERDLKVGQRDGDERGNDNEDQEHEHQNSCTISSVTSGEVDSALKDTKIRMHGDSGQSCHTVKGIELMAPDTREDVVQLDVDRAAAAAKKGHPRVQ